MVKNGRFRVLLVAASVLVAGNQSRIIRTDGRGGIEKSRPQICPDVSHGTCDPFAHALQNVHNVRLVKGLETEPDFLN